MFNFVQSVSCLFMIYTAHHPEEMKTIARELLLRFPDGGHFALHGPMGVGKTTLMQAICENLGLKFEGSPTFALVHEYHLPEGKKLFHFDLYRLNSPEELSAIGFEEYLDSGHYVFIEWPERGGSLTAELQPIVLSDDNGARVVQVGD